MSYVSLDGPDGCENGRTAEAETPRLCNDETVAKPDYNLYDYEGETLLMLATRLHLNDVNFQDSKKELWSEIDDRTV